MTDTMSLKEASAALDKTESQVVAMALSGKLDVLDFEIRDDGLVRFGFSPAVVKSVAATLRDKAA
jgi:hypothetical protein